MSSQRGPRNPFRVKNVDTLRQYIDQVCRYQALNLKGLGFGEAIALSQASADFPLPRIPKGSLENEFQGSLLLFTSVALL